MKIRKVGTYNTRHMVATVHDALGRGLIKMGKYEEVKDDKPPAVKMEEPPEAKPKVVDVPDDEQESDRLEMLREEAEELGIHVDKRWGAARLQEAIASQSKD